MDFLVTADEHPCFATAASEARECTQGFLLLLLQQIQQGFVSSSEDMDPNHRTHQGGYSSLSPSSLPGSVPVAADVDDMLLPFQEANLQTFPPSDARSKLLGSYPPNHEADDSAGSRAEPGDSEGRGSVPRIFRIGTYQPYFNVDTTEVSQRIVQSISLIRGDFMTMTNHNPDLYGPFWICTTLIFVASAFGNYATYLLNHASWQFDISKVTWAAGLFYGYTFLLPLALYFVLKYIGVSLGLIQLWCLYGYSLFVFIPASVVALIPVTVLKWVIIAGAGLVSTTFVTMNLKTHLGSSERSYIVAIGSLILQCCFALAFKIIFFG